MKKVFLILFFIVCLGNTLRASEDEAGWFGNWLDTMERTAKSPPHLIYTIRSPQTICRSDTARSKEPDTINIPAALGLVSAAGKGITNIRCTL